MLPCYHIVRIDKQAARHSLGAVNAYAVRRSALPQIAGDSLIVMGHLFQTPEDEEPALARAATDLAPMTLEISNGEKTFCGAFKVMQFDPVSLLTMFWSDGPVETIEHHSGALAPAY